MPKIDIGDDEEPLTDEEIESALKGIDTAELDAAVDAEYGKYLDGWSGEIRSAIGSS
jgi:hypothetical protein